MTRRVTWLPSAIRDMTHLDRQVARRIELAVGRLAETRHGNVRPLTAQQAGQRLRVGDWRVLFDFEDDAQTITVVRVLHWSEAYRR
jgi:mRNA interferase RelE/StbE